jgi:hypothetical protein
MLPVNSAIVALGPGFQIFRGMILSLLEKSSLKIQTFINKHQLQVNNYKIPPDKA